MPIAREGKFLVSRTLGNTAHLGLESGMLEDCVEEVLSKGYKGVFGSPAFGFKEPTLQALQTLPHLESLWFWDIELQDIETIYSLGALQFLGIHPKRPAIDFERLPL